MSPNLALDRAPLDEQPPRPVQASRAGILVCRRAQGGVRAGDCVALVASELGTWPGPG